ncbi:ABC transporter permease [Flavobacteriaceae bacterium GF1]
MNTIKMAFRTLFRKGEQTPIRLVSLIAGLAFSLLLLSEVLYNYSYDSFYPDSERIYVVHENFKRDESSTQLESYPRVSGAIAPGLKAEVPGIESATRLNSIGEQMIYTQELKSIKADVSLADEHLFEVLPRTMVTGNAQEILTSPVSCMISQEMAERIGGNVMGKTIELKRYPDKKVTIKGIFETLPENTNYRFDMLISMVSTDQFFSWDGTTNWMGNDRYYACVKLKPNIEPESLAPAVRAMQVKHQDIERLEEENNGVVLQYSFEPITKLHAKGVKTRIIILATIAFAVLFVSLLNYVLLTMGALIKRAKNSAIHKTCGAKAKNLQKMIFAETFVLFAIAIIGAVLTIWGIKPLAEAQMGHSLEALTSFYIVGPIALLALVLMVLIGYFPGRFYSRIPVSTVFRNYKQKKSKWKLALLSLQFMGATFILTVLVIVTFQYNDMRNLDHGYTTQGVFYGSTTGMDGQKLGMVINELKALPGVEKVGLGDGVPIDGASGNNILSPDQKRELFNVADFYSVDEDYLSILGINMVRGEGFSKDNSVAEHMIISEKGAGLLKLNNSWQDGVVGKQVTITEHGSTTIKGVFNDFVIHSISSPDHRPAVFFYLSKEGFEELKIQRPSSAFNILVQVNENVQAGILDKITDVFNLGFPYKDAVVKSLEDERINTYQEEKGFKNAMLIGNIIILIITVIGIVGYTTNESIRRRKELAIRRISGATLSDILRTFISDLELVAVPAVGVGLVGAWLVADRWMQNFAHKIPLDWTIFTVSSLFILVLIALISSANYIRTAQRNPSEALRYE